LVRFFAVALIDASVIGAMAISLSTAYAIGDVLSLRHSLHRKPTEAKAFCSPRHPPIDPLEQHRQLRPAQDHHALLGTRPDESPALQPLGEQTQAIAIPPQQLDQIATATAKAKHVTRERILPEHRLRLSRRLSKPLRMSVTPAASHTRVPAAREFIAAVRSPAAASRG
jgi:hypothetical protein